MMFTSFARYSKFFFASLNKPSVHVLLKKFRHEKQIRTSNNSEYCKHYFWESNLYIAYSLTLFGFFNDKETPEDKLIKTIKRSILCIQHKEYAKAEQMLHLALRMAQDIQSQDGVTYVYDIMANLAMEREQFQKAESLFVNVLQRLLGNGLPDNSPKILHISAKLAHIAQQKGDIEKSRIGFMWTLGKIEEIKKKMPNDIHIQELCALTTNWFGQLSMMENNFQQAKECFKYAYDSFVELHGSTNKEAIVILNNLSVACTNMGNFHEAKEYILIALDVVNTSKDKQQECILLANLGLICLQEGLIKEATTYCSQAWKIATIKKNYAAIAQADYCLNEIKANSRE